MTPNSHEVFLPDNPIFIIPFVVLLAFFIKGATGFGTALVMMPILTVLIGLHDAIVVSSICDTVGGAILFFLNPMPESRRFWIPMAAAMIVGSVIGGIILGLVPVEGFETALAIIILVLGFWFLSGKNRKDQSKLPSAVPQNATAADMGVSAFSGLCGGLFGISGPPIVFYLGSRMAKAAFRSTLVAVFLFGGIARLTTYSFNGILSLNAFVISLVSLPALLIGLYIGNHLFVRIPEVWFSRLIGVVLILAAVRLVL